MIIANIWKFSILGWNTFSNGTPGQRLIAAIAAGAIVGGTKSALEVVTGIKEKQRKLEEENRKRMKETDGILNNICQEIQFENIKKTQEEIEKILENLED